MWPLPIFLPDVSLESSVVLNSWVVVFVKKSINFILSSFKFTEKRSGTSPAFPSVSPLMNMLHSWSQGYGAANYSPALKAHSCSGTFRGLDKGVTWVQDIASQISSTSPSSFQTLPPPRTEGMALWDVSQRESRLCSSLALACHSVTCGEGSSTCLHGLGARLFFLSGCDIVHSPAGHSLVVAKFFETE